MQVIEPCQTVLPQRGVVIDALGRTKPFDAVDMLHALGNQTTTLAMQTLGIFQLDAGNALVGEVFCRDFANRRKLGSYVGLGSSPFCSGSVDRNQGISKAGNPMARSMMVELAWTWLRYQRDSALSIWFRERVGNLKGRPRRIAIVAMARKLLVALWRYLETGLVPTGAVLKA